MAKTKAREFDGALIKEARETAGMTQKEITEKAGTSRQQLIEIEHGAKSNPTVKTIQAIADALGCDATDFFRYKPSKRKKA